MEYSSAIPEDPLSSAEEHISLQLHPFFTGPFQLPDDYESASPAYLIKPSRRVEFKKDVRVEIQHYACLESEEDCDDMVFLSASATPELRESGPVYIFQKEEAKGVFKPGYQVGVVELVSLRTPCLIKAGKRKQSSLTNSSKGKDDSLCNGYVHSFIVNFPGNTFYYSARLYRSLSRNFATFCICLYHEVYMKVCTLLLSPSSVYITALFIHSTVTE